MNIFPWYLYIYHYVTNTSVRLNFTKLYNLNGRDQSEKDTKRIFEVPFHIGNMKNRIRSRKLIEDNRK